VRRGRWTTAYVGAAIVVVLGITGCDGSSTTTTTSTTALTPLIGTATSAQTETAPTSGLSPYQYNRVLQALRNASTDSGRVANALNAVNPQWNVTAEQLDAFARTACFTGVHAAWDGLRPLIPGAQLSAMPALNQAILLVPQRCVITNQQALDILSNLVTGYVLSNQPTPVAAIPSSAPPAPSNSSSNALYNGICAALSSGLGYWTKSKVEGEGRGGILLAMPRRSEVRLEMTPLLRGPIGWPKKPPNGPTAAPYPGGVSAFSSRLARAESIRECTSRRESCAGRCATRRGERRSATNEWPGVSARDRSLHKRLRATNVNHCHHDRNRIRVAAKL
jgi:hypothetical protein